MSGLGIPPVDFSCTFSAVLVFDSGSTMVVGVGGGRMKEDNVTNGVADFCWDGGAEDLGAGVD